MIKVVMRSFGVNGTAHSIVSSRCLPRQLFGNVHTANKTDLTWQHMTWNEHLAKKARSLIFGEKKYLELNVQEQKIVDFYQEKILEEDAVILPNTRADLEQVEIIQMLLNRYKKLH